MLAKDIMTTHVVAAHPKTLLVEAARIMFEKNYHGLPVVDENKKLVGLITQQDLISKTSSVHLPTLINLLSQIDIFKKDASLIKSDLEKVLNLTVVTVMNQEPMTITEDTTAERVANVFANHHSVNPILVLDKNGNLCGVISRYDLLKFFAGPLTGNDLDQNQIQKNNTPNVDAFIKSFESRFLLVSKNRTRLWLWLFFTSAIVGFLIAWLWILRVSINNY